MWHIISLGFETKRLNKEALYGTFLEMVQIIWSRLGQVSGTCVHMDERLNYESLLIL